MDERLFFEVFEPLPRQGPGSRACTERALSLCDDLPKDARVLDLGCGCGAQTLDLARASSGEIIAVDMHVPLLARLRERVDEAGLRDRVQTLAADMGALQLPDASFDLVWSEGALYNLGLDRALPMCAALTKPGGYLAFTEAVWRTDDPPPQVREAFADYPSMGRVDRVLGLLGQTGWVHRGHFDLPAQAWWDDFYGPMERRIAQLRRTYADDPDALETLDALAAEPRMHREHGETYGYTFFVARRA